MQYIWQHSSWPKFKWDSAEILVKVGRVRVLQGKLIALAGQYDLKSHADVIAQDVHSTSAIEGERLPLDEIRSSVAIRLGMDNAGINPPSKKIDGVVEMIIDATSNFHISLNAERLYGWQASLFPSGFSGIHQIEIGKFRTSDEEMKVISGPMGKEKVHYIAPPAQAIEHEVGAFLDWFNKSSKRLDGIIRAAVAHFWFVSIHPFDDGNGRISRAIADMAHSQDEESSLRLYSISNQIIKQRDEYCEILEKTQKIEDTKISNAQSNM